MTISRPNLSMQQSQKHLLENVNFTTQISDTWLYLSKVKVIRKSCVLYINLAVENILQMCLPLLPLFMSQFPVLQD